jgi:hypothetical protein
LAVDGLAYSTGLSRIGCSADLVRRSGACSMQQLSAGSQFTDRPMENINRSGPSEARIEEIQALMAGFEASGRAGAARAAGLAKQAELAGMPKMDAAIEEEHRAEIELAKLTAADMMRCGDVDGAVKALRAMQPWLCPVTELGSRVLMDLAMALDTKRDPEASEIFKSLSRSPDAEVRNLAKMMAGVDESEGFIKL